MKHLLVIFLSFAACVEDNSSATDAGADASPAWLPECDEDNDAMCWEWDTQCLDDMLQMCICGQWTHITPCNAIGGACALMPSQEMYSCVDTWEEGLGQGEDPPGGPTDAVWCHTIWMQGIATGGDPLPYLCYYFPDSYCAAEWEGGLCN